LTASPAAVLESTPTRENIEDIESDEAFVRKTGISKEDSATRNVPVLDELTRLNHELLAVIEAAYLAEKAGCDQAEA
jgi:hypothetical protein